MGEQGVPTSANRSAIEVGSATKVRDEKERFESLLLDDSDQGRTVDYIAAQEVKAISARKRGHSGLLPGLLLFFIFLSGIGYYYWFLPQTLSPPNRVATDVLPKLPVPARTEIAIPTAAAVVKDVPVSESEQGVPAAIPVVIKELSLFTVTVGPIIDEVELVQAISQLRELGLKPQERKGRGQVAMIRLLEGVYPVEEGREHLGKLAKVVSSAFLLPDGDKMAVYAGSFHQRDRAKQMQDDLAQQKIDVSFVDSLIVMDGTMLEILKVDGETAGDISALISSFGLQAQLQKEK